MGESFTVFDQYGNILYKYGEGSTVITVVDIEHISVDLSDGSVICEIDMLRRHLV